MRIVEPSAEMLACTKFPAGLIERAGRTCYKSEGLITSDSSAKFVGMILNRGHESVIEHAAATFRFVTDRGISHEIVRHRLASYSQESTRYCNYGKSKFGEEITVVRPSQIDDSLFPSWEYAMSQAEVAYFELLGKGAKPQTARSVLPTCLKTEIVMTANFREWRHFIKLRLQKAAHPDIRPLAHGVLVSLYGACPAVFMDLMDLATAYEDEA